MLMKELKKIKISMKQLIKCSKKAINYIKKKFYVKKLKNFKSKLFTGFYLET